MNSWQAPAAWCGGSGNASDAGGAGDAGRWNARHNWGEDSEHTREHSWQTHAAWWSADRDWEVQNQKLEARMGELEKVCDELWKRVLQLNEKVHELHAENAALRDGGAQVRSPLPPVRSEAVAAPEALEASLTASGAPEAARAAATAAPEAPEQAFWWGSRTAVSADQMQLARICQQNGFHRVGNGVRVMPSRAALARKHPSLVGLPLCGIEACTGSGIKQTQHWKDQVRVGSCGWRARDMPMLVRYACTAEPCTRLRRAIRCSVPKRMRGSWSFSCWK